MPGGCARAHARRAGRSRPGLRVAWKNPRANRPTQARAAGSGRHRSRTATTATSWRVRDGARRGPATEQVSTDRWALGTRSAELRVNHVGAREHNRLGAACKLVTIESGIAMDASADKDLPLKEDTRLLGRLLGDVLRAQTGPSGFARVEAIRQTAIRFRRAGPADAPAMKRELDALLNGLPLGLKLE